jgi:hypothetical protein
VGGQVGINVSRNKEEEEEEEDEDDDDDDDDNNNNNNNNNNTGKCQDFNVQCIRKVAVHFGYGT